MHTPPKTGDTAAALDAWRRYQDVRRGAEPAQRAADDSIRKQVEALERVKR